MTPTPDLLQFQGKVRSQHCQSDYGVNRRSRNQIFKSDSLLIVESESSLEKCCGVEVESELGSVKCSIVGVTFFADSCSEYWNIF